MKWCFIISVVVLVVSGCAGSGSNADDSRKTVTVSIPPQAWILREIAGDSIRVNVLLAAGANPETFEPGVSVMRRTADSDVLMLSGGLSYETQLADKFSESNPGIVIVDTSRGIVPIYGTHNHVGHHHHHSGDAADPHTWTSVRNVRTIAANMLSVLESIDEEHAEYYRGRYSEFDARLDSLDRSISERLDTLSQRTFMIWHPSLSYFARDYGLEQLSIGVDGKETTPLSLRSIIDNAADKNVEVLFIQADFDPSKAETLGRETGAKVVLINPLDIDWESQINVITDALSNR